MKLGLIVRSMVLGALALQFSACGRISNVLNPFYEPPTEVATLGERSDRALNENGQKAQNARQALESMASYQRTHLPQPANPVMNPAIVRLMWIPDHLNSNGDLVPAHFYYLKVKSDAWAVTDAFELQQQLNGGRERSTSNVPFVYENENLK